MKKFMFIALTAIMFTLTACDGNKTEATYGVATDSTAVDSTLTDSIAVVSADSAVVDTLCVDSVK